MLFTEWNMEEALAVNYKEGYEIGYVIDTMQRKKETPLNIAKELLSMGLSAGDVQKYTGVDMETLMELTGDCWWLPVRYRTETLLDMEGDGMEEVRKNITLNIARKLLARGSTPDIVQKVTGLDMETIESL